MPILPVDDPILAGVPKRVDLTLPDIPEIFSDAGNAPIFSASLGRYVAQSAEIFQLASQLGLKGLLTNVGMPIKQSFDVMLDAMRINVQDEVLGKLSEGGRNLQEAWKDLQKGGENGTELKEISVDTAVGTGVNMAAVIPVAGWIVKILWSVAKAIKGIAQLVRDSKPEQVERLYGPTTFNPRLDNDVLNGVLSDVHNRRDWGRRWGPPAMGSGVGTTPDFDVLPLEGGGFEIVRKSGYTDEGPQIDWASEGWTGMVPGTPYLHQGIQVSHAGTVRDMGTILLPSSREVLLWVWGSVLGHGNTATPSMYCVDIEPIERWAKYIHDLHVFIHDKLDASDSLKRKIIEHFNKRGSQQVFGWGTSIKPTENEADNYWPVEQARTLRKRQFGMLDTLMVAYVDGSYSAIKGDSQMRSKWIQRRKDLLQHPARCDVDVSSVPDTDYREALRAAGVRAGICRAQIKLGYKTPDNFEPPSHMPDGAEYGSPPGRVPRRGMGLVGFSVITGTAYLALRHSMRKRR